MAAIGEDSRLTPQRIDEICCKTRLPESNSDLRGLVVALARDLRRQRIYLKREKKTTKQLKDEVEFLQVWRDHNSSGQHAGANVQGNVSDVRSQAGKGNTP